MTDAIQQPVASMPVADASGAMTRSWYQGLSGIFRRVKKLQQVSSITTADIAAAPGAYNQAYTQTIADLVNELKSKHNSQQTAIS